MSLRDPLPGPNPGGVDESTAAWRTAARTALPAALWIMRIAAAHYANTDVRGTVAVLIVDLLLVIAQSWANRPLRTAMGARFGWLRSYSALPYCAWLLAVLLLLRDMWFIIAHYT